MKPLFKWSGGKQDEIKNFEEHIPKDFETYVEPFVGGGSLFFHLSPKKAVINDVHKELVDFYRSIKEGKGTEIHDFMLTSPNDEETYYKVRNEMVVENELDSAKRFYYQRKTCFRGMLRYNKHGKFNIPFGRYKKISFSEVKDTRYYDLLQRTEVHNEDFEKIFQMYDDEKYFFFLDPPYDSEFTDYGYCKFGKEEHLKLASLFKKSKSKCLMIIGKTKLIQDLYSEYIVDEYAKKYKFKIHSGRVGNEIDTNHLIIKNY